AVDPKLAARIKRDNETPHPMGPPLNRPPLTGDATSDWRPTGNGAGVSDIPDFLRRRPGARLSTREGRSHRTSRSRAMRSDLLKSLPDACAALAFFDPQFREVLDKLAYGNEGARQAERCKLPQMSADYIDACRREIGRVLRPSGYCFRWVD